jgi:hypothetical protein
MLANLKMLRRLVGLYCLLAVGLVAFSQEYNDGSFYVIRGTVRDQFVNILCTRNDSCPTSSCARYNAVCDSRSCKYCLCANSSATYLPNDGTDQGKCMQDSAIERTTGEFTTLRVSYIDWVFNNTFSSNCNICRYYAYMHSPTAAILGLCLW